MQDPKAITDILAEAHGEVGLGKMKKMLKKMLKRVNEERVRRVAFLFYVRT